MSAAPTATHDARPRVAVLGLGNVLLGDDAVGPYVVERLMTEYAWPEGVTLLDVGTPGLDLPGYFADCDLVVLVDAVADDAAPGSLRVLDRQQIEALPMAPRVSPHDPVLREALCLADLAERPPGNVLLVGVVPETLAVGAGLSDAVRAAATRAVDTVVRILATHGVRPVPQSAAGIADTWWQDAATRVLR